MAQDQKDKAGDQKASDKAQKEAAPETKEVIEFYGPGKEVTIRRMMESDWTTAGIDGLPETDWRQENNWTHDLEDFRGHIPEVREWVTLQPDFRISEVPVEVEEA